MATTPKKQRGHTPGKSAAPTTRGNDTALVHLRGNEPVTDSLAIAREFGRPHKNVLQSLDSLIADSTINRLDFEPVDYVDAKGEKRRMLELTERGALIAMPFIGGRSSRVGQPRLVDAFLALRRELSARTAPDRLAARRDAASNYSVLSEMLVLTREAEGKPTKAHHFANEARLVNEAFCGVFGPLDRDTLSAAQLRILNRLQVRDAALIGSGKTYAERKSLLASYATSLRAAPRLSGGVQ